MRVRLQVTEGPHAGRAFTFEGHSTFLVGRSRQAHFRLASRDQYFSRYHFLLEVNPPQCHLVDLQSRNGTYVNGQKVAEADLRDGDQIRAGHTVLRVAVEASPAGPTAPAPAGLPGPVMVAPPAAGSGEPSASGATCPGCGGPTEGRPAAVPALCPACRGSAPASPQAIPGYQFLRELGCGRMGVVWLAVHQPSGALAAVKTFRPDAASPREVENFLREGRILGTLNHPHIVAFGGMGEAEGRLYFVMEYVPGGDDLGLLRRHGPLPVGRAVALACQLLEALEYLHGRGVVHHNVKPQNLLVKQQAGGAAVKLAGFGLARASQAPPVTGLALTGRAAGTPAYMPPEQIRDFRSAGPAADQYAAAAVLYRLLTDRLLFDLKGQAVQELFARILGAAPVPLASRRPDVPAGLAEAVHRALAKDPAGRFADAAAFREALDPFL
jgi:serine/threonine-protein kinase